MKINFIQEKELKHFRENLKSEMKLMKQEMKKDATKDHQRRRKDEHIILLNEKVESDNGGCVHSVHP